MRSLRLLEKMSPDAVDAVLNNEEGDFFFAIKKLVHVPGLLVNLYADVKIFRGYTTLTSVLEIPSHGFQSTSISPSITVD